MLARGPCENILSIRARNVLLSSAPLHACRPSSTSNSRALYTGTDITHLLPLPQTIMCLVYPLPFRDVVLAVEAGKRDAVDALLDAPKRRLDLRRARHRHTQLFG